MTGSARFFGLDLAWSAKNPTGACVLGEDGVIIDEGMLSSNDEIIGWIERHLVESAVVGIDAPLLVRNETGRRPCEAELSREYGSRKAGTHPANRSRLEGVHGEIRGELLAARLADLGFGDPWAGLDRTVLEVYPHPAIIEAFGLDERLIYKSKRGVSVDARRGGLRTLSHLLGLLKSASPPLVGPSVTIADEVRGRALKAVEDRLDARMCSWIASVWGTAPDRIRLFGDPATGHIAVPTGAFASTPPTLMAQTAVRPVRADRPQGG